MSREVAQNEVFELQPHHRIPAGQQFHAGEGEHAGFDFRDAEGDVP